MFNTREKKERSLGIKLFLKAHRCSSPKCVTSRNPNPPGPHKKSGGRRQRSEFGEQMRAKQRIKITYGIRESAMEKVALTAAKSKGITGEMIMNLLERRLDNVVYRVGFAQSRAIARQLVSHGHMFVNGRKVTIPSYVVRKDDVISIRPESKEHGEFRELKEYLKRYVTPVWLAMDQEKVEGKVMGDPKDFDNTFDLNKIVDYYSK